MEEVKRDLGYWLYLDIENNAYLNKLYCKLVFQYTNSLLKTQYFLKDEEICHLQRFVDILSKSNSTTKASFHKNIAQNIVCILNKLYPDNELNKMYMGAVLSSVNNYVGLTGTCVNYRNPDLIEHIYETVVKESYRLPEACGEDVFFDAAQRIAFENIKSKQFYSFSGPTSMGKTFLVKMFIKEQIVYGRNNNYVIVVPSKALINEIKSEIISTIGEYLYEKNYKVITTPGAVTGGDLDFFCFHDGLPVAADHGLSRLRVFLLYLLPDFVRRRGKYAYAFFPAHYVPSKVIFPCVKSGDKGSVGLLHGDQQRIVEAVIMEL